MTFRTWLCRWCRGEESYSCGVVLEDGLLLAEAVYFVGIDGGVSVEDGLDITFADNILYLSSAEVVVGSELECEVIGE